MGPLRGPLAALWKGPLQTHWGPPGRAAPNPRAKISRENFKPSATKNPGGAKNGKC